MINNSAAECSIDFAQI